MRVLRRALATEAGRDASGDFAHHARGVARLNHGSFGAAPQPVLEAADAARSTWLAQPDAEYFSGSLDADLEAASTAAAELINASSAALVENATVAACIAFHRWRARQKDDDTLLLPSNAYGGVRKAAEAYLGPRALRTFPVAFPGTSAQGVLEALDAALRRDKPRFVVLDHVSSQPALVLPIADMVALSYHHGAEEVFVDGAHAAGQLPVDVNDIGADFYVSNLHKWAFAPPTAAVLHATKPLHHVVPSWAAGEGLAAEARWTGTRDYAAFRAVPRALAYLRDWRSADGRDAMAHNAAGLARAVAKLEDAWGVAPACDPALFGSMGMLRLPETLDVSRDAPGQPATPASLRARLRDEYGVEAAVGGFAVDGGLWGFCRLSHAVYTTEEDVNRLRDAVLDLYYESIM